MDPGDRPQAKRWPEEIILPKPKKLRTDDGKHAADFALIDFILMQRTQHAQSSFVTRTVPESPIFSSIPRDANASSFIPLTNTFGDRVYLPIVSESTFLRTAREIAHNYQPDRIGSDETWSKVYSELENERSRHFEQSYPSVEDQTTSELLWTEIYKPKNYVDLLSEEHTNRALLHWIKLWDAFVFKKPPLAVTAKNSHLRHKEIFFSRDIADQRPRYKLVLLCGPPGTGKSTLAHVIARHAGYNPMEMNASEERTLDVFRNVLVNVTTNTSVHSKAPNCLIFDEIDGAPAASVDFLCKFANDQYGRSKQKKMKLQRPIVCICNDAYGAALRPLRQMAFVLHIGVGASRLLARLEGIAGKERMRINRTALMALVERSESDVRTCLTNLQFYRKSDDRSKETELQKCAGAKNTHRSLFQIWEHIFYNSHRGREIGERWKDTVSLVGAHGGGDFDKMAAGVFENYANMYTGDLAAKSGSLGSLHQAMEWFCMTDCLNRQIHETQQYALSVYLPYAFVVWHFTFALHPKAGAVFDSGGLKKDAKKLQYPTVAFEANQKRLRMQNMTSQIMRFMSPSTRAQYTSSGHSLLLDVLPAVHRLLANPPLRPVNTQFFTQKERTTLAHLVNVMLDYGLQYIQERNADGSYTFRMDPNIEELVAFTDVRLPQSCQLSFQAKFTRQLIAHEVSVEKMRRLAIVPTGESSKVTRKVQPPPPPKPSGGTQRKDAFFNVFGVKSTLNSAEAPIPKPNEHAEKRKRIYFKFKEGHTNAVRRPILISELPVERSCASRDIQDICDN